MAQPEPSKSIPICPTNQHACHEKTPREKDVDLLTGPALGLTRTHSLLPGFTPGYATLCNSCMKSSTVSCDSSSTSPMHLSKSKGPFFRFRLLARKLTSNLPFVHSAQTTCLRGTSNSSHSHFSAPTSSEMKVLSQKYKPRWTTYSVACASPSGACL